MDERSAGRMLAEAFPRWRELGRSILADGAVSIELERGAARVVLQVRPSGERQALASGVGGDVSYSEAEGVDAKELVVGVQDFARRLVSGGLSDELPHLRALPTPAPGETCAGVPFTAAGVAELLLPEWGLGGPLRLGFTLRAIEPAASARFRLRFVGASGETVELFLGHGGHGFRVAGDLRLEASRPEGTLVLTPAAGRLCSAVTALLRERRAGERLGAAPEPTATIEAPGEGMEEELTPHLFALRVSGFTIIRDVLPATELAELAEAADRCVARARAALSESGPFAHTIHEVHDPDIFVLNRCFYCWGDASLRLLEHETIRRIADRMIGPQHKLHEMAVQVAWPARGLDPARAAQWHRDIDVTPWTPRAPEYLWFMFPLDDFTADNGATWVVPGSQYVESAELPGKELGPGRFPSRMQLLARRGDLIVLNPLTLHTWGHNRTDQPRRMANVMLCAPSARTLLDHWTIAGPDIQRGASNRVRQLLAGPQPEPSDSTWAALPVGWNR